MRVKCKKCHEHIDSVNIDLPRNIAKCDKCGEIFNCAEQLDGIASQGPATAGRSEIPLPKNLKVEYAQGELLIIKRWMEPALFGLLFFCVFWDGFLIVWYTIAIIQKQWAMAAFGTIHALVGIGLTYGLVCGFVNRTEMRVSRGRIQIRHVPFPVFKAKEFSAGDIAQLYTKRRVSRGNNGSSIVYEVRMKSVNGRDERLVDFLSQQDHGLYIEQQIERYLGIADVSVGGEVERF